METPTISINGQKLLVFLDSKMYDGSFTNEDLVLFIEQVGRYLGLQTIPDYAKENKMSYNGVKKFREIKKILNVKFVIDNLKTNKSMKKIHILPTDKPSKLHLPYDAFIEGAEWQQEQIGKSEFLQKLRATLSDAEARRLIFKQFKKK